MKHIYEAKGNSRIPAPFIPIEIYNPCDKNKAVNFTGLLDTGSDSTLIPKNFLDCINVKPSGRKSGIGGVNKSRKFQPYTISLKFGYIEFDCYEIWAWDSEYNFALIGRDLINKFDIQLYGKKEYFNCLPCD